MGIQGRVFAFNAETGNHQQVLECRNTNDCISIAAALNVHATGAPDPDEPGNTTPELIEIIDWEKLQCLECVNRSEIALLRNLSEQGYELTWDASW